ncbi:transglutaminase family protein [Halopseudomonas nanhaiensis]|uniref:transglutaminase family protein n=1 Tax=Halopseudomonas nanhaiensis TaxID=2830842 RepID=UPI001CBAC50B|nr:transglutaminase family protein [Halopseudomonas nanhaiensis]UAW99849.1 transglutaminase family protein [Halopseudomonas nanhaiensis]
MTIRVALRHSTRYDFDKPVSVAPHQVRLRPAPHCRTPIEAYSLKIDGGEYFLNWQQDPFGNHVARLVFPEKIDHLYVDVELQIPMTVVNPFDFFVEEYAEHFPFEYPEALRKELGPYLEKSEAGPLLNKWLESVSQEERPITGFLVDINQRLSQDIEYLIRMEPGVQTHEETLTLKRGSCRDTSWLLVQIFRQLGLAARFVSGYLIQLTADVKALDGPSGTEVDFTDLHAWCEVFIPGAGWIGLDPTSGLFAGEGHLPLAATPEPSSAAPITGATEPCEVEFGFEMSVERVHEDPRVTKPYTEDEWQRIDALGDKVDAQLNALDVRLTMGGEPTFVSIDDMDAPEWTIAAQGPTKRGLSEKLLKRLRPHYAPRSLIHYQQGKWYPGEPLPRWALACYWRRDGQPMWQDDRWLADMDTDYDINEDDARIFARELVGRLGISDRFLIPCFEDAYYYLWLEQNQPVDIDLHESDLKDDENRARLARLLERGLDSLTGLTLPLAKSTAGKGWESGAWPVRRNHLFLVPGDSPMGLRLPLSALPIAKRDELLPRSLFEPLPALADIHGEVASRYNDQQAAMIKDMGRHHQGSGQDWQEQQPDMVDGGVIGTALCVEPRDGKLFVFLPPLVLLEDYIELLATVEQTAAHLNMPVCVEGYPPPSDPRVEKFMITPDPGVIEVNVMPAASWKDMVRNTRILYEEARQTRLGTEKFMLDGRHTGTGGGNHVTLGGQTPADSPFLRRPDLLASMLTFWQHHPSLSYLFSGLFIGPTSQAPRVDEARHEAIYELEIALGQMPKGEVPQPWLVDRLLRHLLTDITGNTHRAEFCIDKLYSPDSATGRLGLLELRGFEMPPHPEMSLMQQLLIRALVARFFAEPYRQPLVRWGTALHDKWMMPHFIWEDLGEVIADLRAHGFAFEQQWFAPFLEFRFPHIGNVRYQGVGLEIRQAIEPWHVLGEEAAGGGTARYVDSSVERVEVKVSDFNASRHVLTCNGVQVPLQFTGVPGEAVAAVRYRAWQPPSALHPNIPVHAPLVFDLVDRWNQRSMGGCTYHVVHPAGRNYETFPVNANEAEARRMARFWDHGHTQGRIVRIEQAPGQEYPHTLDLRRAAIRSPGL